MVYSIHIFLTAAFFDYFIAGDTSKSELLSPVRVACAGLILIGILLFLSKAAPSLITVQYGYLAAGLAVVIPALVILFTRPRLFLPAIKTVPFFFFLYLFYDLTSFALTVNEFNGTYLGMLTVVGLRFPVEELVFWMILNSAVVTVYYSYFLRNDTAVATPAIETI